MIPFKQFVVEFDRVFRFRLRAVKLTDALVLSIVDCNTVFVIFERWRLLLLDQIFLLGAIDVFTLEWVGFGTLDVDEFVLVGAWRVETLEWV